MEGPLLVREKKEQPTCKTIVDVTTTLACKINSVIVWVLAVHTVDARQIARVIIANREWCPIRCAYAIAKKSSVTPHPHLLRPRIQHSDQQ